MRRCFSGYLVANVSRQRRWHHYALKSRETITQWQRDIQEELRRHPHLKIRRERCIVRVVVSMITQRGSGSSVVRFDKFHLGTPSDTVGTYRTVCTHSGRSTAVVSELARLLLPGQRCCWEAPTSAANLPLPYSQGLRTRHTPQYALDLTQYSLLTTKPQFILLPCSVV
jgi:hypothetical protein